MFSYRHGFHAGNHADVLKHSVLLYLIDYFQQKDAPYWLIDTHAGAGVYDLQDDWSQQSGEYQLGIERVWHEQALPPMLDRYVSFLETCESEMIYPGSPWISLATMRHRDKARLFEWHPNEVQQLRHFVEQQDRWIQRNTKIFHDNGFKGLLALLPPPSKRAITIMDPAYENKQDYRAVCESIQGALKRFATGCYMVWYPCVKRVEKQDMIKYLEKLPVSWLHASLEIKQASGMNFYGSGLFIVNPPYTLHSALAESLPVLVDLLGQDDHAKFMLKTST